jgi:Asp-tRNA(Asn)/Glu-tRNA(Gln) amidotransferase B subunit
MSRFLRRQFGTRCEIKNVNSIRFVKRAIEYEARRRPGMGEEIKELREMKSLFDRTFDGFHKEMEPAYDRVSAVKGSRL